MIDNKVLQVFGGQTGQRLVDKVLVAPDALEALDFNFTALVLRRDLLDVARHQVLQRVADGPAVVAHDVQ